jgi:hypothetical protein
VPLGSLPLYFRGDASAFPKHGGYLKADSSRISAWRDRLAALGGAYTVGVSWQGGTYATRLPLRSIPLDDWLPLLTVPGIRFVSLQYTPEAQAALHALGERHGVHVEHWPEAIGDYDETAALVSALDLTVSVCTSVSHLAGALGRPVWVLVPSNPEWRYGHAGETMLWYPSARLFRQVQARDWTRVIEDVERGLRRQIARDKASPSAL